MATGLDNRDIFETALDQHAVKYTNLEYTNHEDFSKPAVVMSYMFDSGLDIDVFFWFDEDGESTHFETSGLVRVPEHRQDDVLKAINVANFNYRWLAFFLDDEGYIRVRGDHVLVANVVGDVCYELLQRTLSVCDEAYAEFMHFVWSG